LDETLEETLENDDVAGRIAAVEAAWRLIVGGETSLSGARAASLSKLRETNGAADSSALVTGRTVSLVELPAWCTTAVPCRTSALSPVARR
jgi:hypothetical protein